MNLGIIGCKRSLRIEIGDDCETVSKKAGLNFGNLLFQHACKNLIAGDYLGIGINSTWDIRKIRSHCEKIIFPSANFINEELDFGPFADLLEKLDLPIISIGLGAQSGLVEKKKIKMKPGTRRLIDILSDKANVIGVRGEYTQSVLDQIGIKNTQVIGCPSNLLTSTKELKRSFHSKLKRKTNFITVNGHHPWTTDSELKKLESVLFNLAYSYDGDYLAQSHDPLIKLASKSRFCSLKEWRDILKSLHSVSGLSTSLEAFEKFARKNIYYETDVPSWLYKSSFYDFSIGLRLHGNMISFQGGTPSLWIAHDSRTHELIETMKLPHLSWPALKKAKVTDYRGIFSEQLDSYFERRSILEKRFAEFLKKNNLESSKILR